MERREMREFHISRKSRDAYKLDAAFFSLQGRVVMANLAQAKELTKKLMTNHPDIRHQDVFAMGLLDEIFHYVIQLYGKDIKQTPAKLMLEHVCRKFGVAEVRKTIEKFTRLFPPSRVYQGLQEQKDYLDTEHDGTLGEAIELEEMFMLWLENQNPAYTIAKDLFDDGALVTGSLYLEIMAELKIFYDSMPFFGPEHQNLVEMLRAPAQAFPNSLELQLEYVKTRWGYLLGDLLMKLLRSIDFLKEANAYFLRKGMSPGHGGESHVPDYSAGAQNSVHEEYERFSPDRDWMPKVVLLAKTTLVWLDQLSKQYNRDITRLDQIPDEELDLIAGRGFNCLWLIGLWERSDASRLIKNRCGNPEAAASAYALHDYEIAGEIGAWAGLENLRWRAWNRGIRLASDMVPNHTGIDSAWVSEHPDWFIQAKQAPFPGYTYNSENLSKDPNLGIYLEDHYYNQSDAAVTFKREDKRTGDIQYIYHGNDGTHMPWNDTAQLNFTKADVREAIIQTIIHVAKNFPVIRFDAAMTLAKRHIQRLWFPEPGHGGDIPSRAEYGMSNAEFNAAIPVEFWREVVDRVAVEAPDTLLLAEAFWMMEGYFVRTLGMHRVYNSAFMNMLKNEDNAKYRQTIKNTMGFDKDILKRFVNFMNNPDEETAIAQFGNGDKYFGVCTLMITMPGLPMFGHGQVEGYTEKYGMEYRKAYRNEVPDNDLVKRHYREIFPLAKKRYLFADVENFNLFDLYKDDGAVNENVFAYTNSVGVEHALVIYNNAYEATYGTLRMSAGFLHKGPHGERHMMQKTFAESLSLRNHGSCYVIFRELHSGLWFIRRSSELCDQGMRVILNGYQTQVYLDIHEVQDSESGHYRQLHDALGGKGVADIQDALRELVLKPIFDAFNTDLSIHFWQEAVSLFDKSVLGKAAVIDRLLLQYQNFIGKTRGFATKPELYQEHAFAVRPCLESAVQVINFINEWNLPSKASNPEKGIDLFVRVIRDGLKDDERRIAFLSFLFLGPLYPENEDWQLQYKVPGIGEYRFQLGTIIGAFHSGMCTIDEKKLNAAEILGTLEIQEYLGVHYYDGVRWYNKERFDEFLWWLQINRLLSIKEQIKLEIVERFAGDFELWTKSHRESGFKFDSLKFGLAPAVEPPAKAKGAKKPDSVAKSARK